MINRGKMPRQLRASGGITNVVPRTNYFLGGIKRRLRKLIPNELASIAVKAAPFVAPFNPAIGAAMAGIGGFDQTGRIGSSLKSAALTYGGGQFARQLGGADLQGNPFTEGGAFRGGLEGLKSGFSSPISSGNVDKIFGKKTVEGISDRVTGGGTEGLLGKLGLTKGGGSLKLTGLGKISAGALASYFVGKGATPEEAKDLTGDVYRGEGIGFDQIRADLEKYKSGEFSQKQMFDKNYRFLTPRNFIAAEGGRAGYQTGGVSSANTLAQNITANQAQAAGIQSMLNAAREQAGLATIQTPQETMPTPVQTMSAPAPSITKSILPPAKTQAEAAKNQGMNLPDFLSGADLESVQSGGYVPGALGDRQLDLGPIANMAAPGGMTNENFMKLSMAEQDKIMANDEAKRLANEKKFTTDAYGKQVDPSRGREIYMNLLDVVKFDQPNVKLTGNETLAELERLAYPQYFAEGGSPKAEIPKGLTMDKALRTFELSEGRKPKNTQELINFFKNRKLSAMGGIMNVPTGKMRKNSAGVMERDYREEGGFVPVGVKEKADDVPAMLSKNEFVMTADAVRGAGNGSIDKGAQKMYNTMKRLEGMVK